MHLIHFLTLATITGGRASAAGLASVCTVSYVQSALPDGAIDSITLSAESVTANAVYNYSVSSGDLWPGQSGLDFCNVTFAYTRNGLENSTTNVWYWLPSLTQFQGRYVSTGGAGFAITSGEEGLSAGLVYGAAAGTTDGGFGSWNSQLYEVVLLANGTIDYDKIFNFGYRSIHEMSVLGKELTKRFYNSSAIYSYYQGCSEGGREGFSQVQRYGSQFDGAAIGAPAIRGPFLQVLHLYSAVVETTHDYAPSTCELEKILNDTLVACDGLDGREDGVVSRSDLCKLHYSANASIGESYACAASGSSSPAANGAVASQAAAIANEIWKGQFDSKGRQVYVSFPPSADFSDAATTYNSETGEYEASVSGIGVEWVNYFLKKIESDSLSLTNITYDTLRAWVLRGLQEYADTLQTNWPDLEDFQSAGGKIIHFHGESDPAIPAGSSTLYHDAVRQVMYPNLGFNESYSQLHDWYRLFLVPGAGHCGSNSEQANGPFPQNVLASVIDWVENGVNPVRLNATVLDGTVSDVQQKICSFPLRPLWRNNGTILDCAFDQASFDTWVPKLDSIPVPVY